MIKYLGSKRALLERMFEALGPLDGVRTVLDAMSGTSRVGHAFKQRGFHVTANDHNHYAAVLARCYVQADARHVRDEATAVIAELGRVAPRAGWFTDTFCVRSRFFHPNNGARIEAMRERLLEMRLQPDIEAVAFVAIMEAADRVDSTVGVQMAYLKSWAARALRPLQLRVPAIVDGPGRATCRDVVELLAEDAYDLVYVDPPYNAHRYLGNYHVWETLVRWDAPEVYGIACKRVDYRDYHSAFNARRGIHAAMKAVIDTARARWLVVSFSDEGTITRAEMEAMLATRGPVTVIEMDHARYVGARIGIYNPRGERVGKVGRVRNTEYLYRVGA